MFPCETCTYFVQHLCSMQSEKQIAVSNLKSERYCEDQGVYCVWQKYEPCCNADCDMCVVPEQVGNFYWCEFARGELCAARIKPNGHEDMYCNGHPLIRRRDGDIEECDDDDYYYDDEEDY